MLIEPSVWRGLMIHDYTLWAYQIWHILALRATRRYVVLQKTNVRLTHLLCSVVSCGCIGNYFFLEGQRVPLIRKSTFSMSTETKCQHKGISVSDFTTTGKLPIFHFRNSPLNVKNGTSNLTKLHQALNIYCKRYGTLSFLAASPYTEHV